MNLRTVGILIAMAWAGLASAAVAAQPPGMPAGWSDAFVYANGARLHYYHAVPQPGKPVMVMMHGVSDNGLSWTTLTEELQGDYDIYMLDARGHGLSDPFPETATGDTAVEDVVAFVHAMNFTKPIVMGHSMGAATVMRLGAEYPDLPRAVIMLDPGLGVPAAPAASPATPPSAPAQPAPRQPGSVSMSGPPELMVAQNNDPYDALLATCARQNAMWDPVDCQYWALSKKQYHGAYTPGQQQAMRGTISTGDALARITAPALILKADATPEVRAANEAAAKVMKNGRLVHVDGARHNLHHDKRARTVELLKEFLAKV